MNMDESEPGSKWHTAKQGICVAQVRGSHMGDRQQQFFPPQLISFIV